MSHTPPPGDKLEALVTLATMDLLSSLAPEQRSLVFELVQVLLLSDEQRRVLHALAAGGVDVREAEELFERSLESEDPDDAAVRRRAVELGDQSHRRQERTLLDSFRLLSPALRRQVVAGVEALVAGDGKAAARAFEDATTQAAGGRTPD